jgi:hypothetical protein
MGTKRLRTPDLNILKILGFDWKVRIGQFGLNQDSVIKEIKKDFIVDSIFQHFRLNI